MRHQKSNPNMGLVPWFASDDTGMSSMWLAGTLSGQFRRPLSYPHDIADFGRCVRLLEAAPELRERLPILAESPQPWPRIWSLWSELESLYREWWDGGPEDPPYPKWQVFQRRFDGVLGRKTA